MFREPAFQQNGYSALVPQNFQAYNRGDMYVPGGAISTGTMMAAAAAATPSALGGTNVHSVPVTFAMPKANARARAVAMATPKATVTTT